MADATTTRVAFWDFKSSVTFKDSSDNVVPEPRVIIEKIYSVFCKLNSSRLREYGVLQFWAPLKTCGRVLLKALNLPFACLEAEHEIYRQYSRTYQYSIDHQNQPLDVVEVNRTPGTKIINGPVATSFLNHLPDFVMDLSAVHHENLTPMLRFALECGLTSYFILPLFYNSQQKHCLGVVECFFNLPFFTFMLELVERPLKNAGLTTFCVQACPSYKNLQTLKHVTYEIEKALQIVTESHDLAVAQVWIPYNNGIHNSSVETKQDLFAVKLLGYCVDVDSDDNDNDLLTSIKEYHNTCDTFPLKMGEGLVWRTLQTYEPHFCRNTFELKANEIMSHKKLLMLLSTSTRCSCFVICLRSVDTGNIDYAFEFLWPRTRNYLILLESLLLTLKRCLPSFKFSSGAQLGDELRVVDVENSTGCGLGFFSILQGNRFSPLPKALEEDCISSSHPPFPHEDVKQLFSTPMIESARNLNGCQRPNFVKRKLTDMYESETDSNDEDRIERKKEREDDEDMLTINVEYADDGFRFNLPISLLTIIVVKKEIQERCKLNPGTYKLKYLDEDEEWILMNTDEHIKHCIRSWRIVKGSHIQLRVQPL